MVQTREATFYGFMSALNCVADKKNVVFGLKTAEF